MEVLIPNYSDRVFRYPKLNHLPSDLMLIGACIWVLKRWALSQPYYALWQCHHARGVPMAIYLEKYIRTYIYSTTFMYDIS